MGLSSAARCRRVFCLESFRCRAGRNPLSSALQGRAVPDRRGHYAKADVAKSRVTKIVSGLQAKGFIDYADDPARDGRVNLLSLTCTGNKKCEEMGEYIWNAHEKLLLELDPEERRSILSSLESLRVGMEAVKKELV